MHCVSRCYAILQSNRSVTCGISTAACCCLRLPAVAYDCLVIIESFICESMRLTGLYVARSSRPLVRRIINCRFLKSDCLVRLVTTPNSYEPGLHTLATEELLQQHRTASGLLYHLERFASSSLNRSSAQITLPLNQVLSSHYGAHHRRHHHHHCGIQSSLSPQSSHPTAYELDQSLNCYALSSWPTLTDTRLTSPA
jgi:hypothetical protein